MILARQWDSPVDMVRPPLRFPSWSPRLSTAARAVLGAASLALASIGALGCGSPPPAVKKGPATAADPSEQGKIDQGRKKIDDANRAFNEKKYDRARKLL